MKRLYLLLVLLCLLTACSDDAPTAAAGTPGKSAPVESLETLAERYRDTPLTVLDIAEREWQGKNAVAVTLSAPLDPKSNLQPYLEVNQVQGGSVEGAWILSDDKRVLYFTATAPRTQYEVVVRDGLPALTGKTLQQRVTQTLTTRDVRPAVSFASQGTVLPARLSNGIPVTVVNVDEVNIDFHRLKDESIGAFLQTLNDSYNHQFYRYDQLKQWGALVYSGRFALNPPANTVQKKAIAVEDIEALQQPGLYLAVLDEAGSYDYRRATTYFVVTDIGLQARVYPDSLLVMTQSLASGKSLSGVSVSVLDGQGTVLQERKSGPEGDARFDLTAKGGKYILARDSNQMALLELTGAALDLSEFELGQRPQLPQEAFVYTPRDLYRPGEVVDFSVLLRSGDGYLEKSQTLNISVHQPDGQQVQQAMLSAQQMGYYYYRFAIPASAATGNWRFDVTNLAGGTASYPFKVEEFLPERMALTFNNGKQEPLRFAADEAVQIPLNGMYLYGAPAAGNRLGASVQVSLLRQPLTQFKGYLFGNELEAEANQKFDLADQFLDQQGNLLVNIDSRWASVRSPLQVQLLSSLYESGGRPVVRAYRAQVWPGESQLGVRPSFGDKNPDANSVVEFDLIQVDRAGKLQALADVQVNLVREDRQYYWVYDDQQGWHYEFTEKEYVERSQNVALKNQIGNKVSFNVDWGRYRLEVKDPHTGTVTTVRFHAGEDWYAWWQESQKAGKSIRPDAVTLALDKGGYAGGDVAQLRINSPHAGEAVVLVEADKVLWLKRISLSDTQGTVDIPVAEEWNRHDTYVSVVVLRPASRSEQVTPNRAFGLVHLPLDRAERKLQLALNAPEKTLPQKDLRTELQVTGSSGQPFANGFVTLAAVDVGVLNITDFKTPDPFDGFFGRRRYSVDSRDFYGRIIELNEFEKARIRFGGDADLSRGGKEPQSDVQILSLFQKPVQLDAQGKATIDLPLPDFNGKVRLMALAFGESRFGHAEHETTIAAPLVTQLGVPRFIALGDSARAVLDVHNLSGAAQELQVEITTRAGLKEKSVQQTVTLAQDAKTTLPFTLESASLQQGVIQVRISGEGFDLLQKEWKIGVRPAYPATVREFNVVMEPGAEASVPADLFAGLHQASTELRMGFGNRANLNLPVHIRDLLHYPYGCLEQTSSGAYPYALASEQNQARFQMTPVTAQQRTERIDAAFTRIAGLQLASGGFGLWDDQSAEEHWLTVYVADFMLNVQEQGFAVPPSMLERTLNRLGEYVNRSGSLFEQRYTDDMDHYRFAYKAYAGYVLSRLNKASLASLRTLHDRERQHAESGLPLLHLAIALQASGDQARADVALKEALIKLRKQKGYLADYGSPIRDQAMMIYLLLKHQLHTEHAMAMSFELANALKDHHWLSTQERNALFMAGVLLETTSSEQWMAKFRVGDSEDNLAQTGMAYRKLEGAALQQALRVNNTGNGRLYVSAQVSGYPLKAPAPLTDDYQIRRQYFDASGKPLSIKQVRTGDLVIVHLEVGSVDTAPDSLAIDFIPAGFELENQNLEHAVKLDDFRVDGKTVKDLQQYTKVMHQEYRDDRFVAALDMRYGQSHLFYLMRAVTPGDFVVPPPYVEDMYRAQRRGIGSAEPTSRVLPR